MYKVLLADDEPEVLEGMEILIPWKEYGFEIAGIAVNGKDALEKLKLQRYDLIITDIRMPVLDGFELITAIQNIEPSIRILILSGYNDFSYAKRAVGLNVKGYLLKPINEEELFDHLKKIKADLDNSVAQKLVMQRYDEITRDKFLLDLSNGSILKKEIVSKALEHKINLDYNCFCCAMLEIDNYFNVLEESSEEAKLCKSGVRHIVEEIVSSRHVGYIFDDLQGVVGIIFCNGNLDYNQIESCVSEVCKCVYQSLNCRVTVGIGNIYHSIEDIKTAREQAKKALERKYFIENDGFIFHKEFEESEKLVWNMDWDLSPLLSAIELLDIKSINIEMDKLMGEVQNRQLSKELLQAFSFSLIFGIGSIIKKYKGSYSELFSKEHVEFLISGYSNFDQFKAWHMETSMKVVNYITNLSGVKSSKIIDDIKKYIDENYSEDISLKSLAGIFYLNSAYLGQLFKNTIGESFSDYLSKKRISEVKKMILMDGFKIQTAIKKAGFQSTEYFYRQFKRYENKSFLEYKQMIGFN